MSRLGRPIGRNHLSTQVKLQGVDCVAPTIGLTEDQQSFYELARGFADNEMKPHAQEWDTKALFPLDVYRKLAELGFAGIFVKDDVGGSSLSRVDTTVIVVQENCACAA